MFYVSIKEEKMRVIDGNNDYLLRKEEFAEQYNNRTISVKELQKKLQLTLQQYRNLRKECYEEGLIKLRRANNQKKERKPKYYSPINRNIYGESYNVRRKGVYYCCCKTVAEAELIVKKLKECEWDKNEIERIKKEVKEELK